METSQRVIAMLSRERRRADDEVHPSTVVKALGLGPMWRQKWRIALDHEAIVPAEADQRDIDMVYICCFSKEFKSLLVLAQPPSATPKQPFIHQFCMTFAPADPHA